jgi:hypothetical protein
VTIRRLSDRRLLCNTFQISKSLRYRIQLNTGVAPRCGGLLAGIRVSNLEDIVPNSQLVISARINIKIWTWGRWRPAESTCSAWIAKRLLCGTGVSTL